MGKKIVAIMAGGESSEHGVSMRSATGIYGWLDKSKYEPYIVEVKKAGWEVHLAEGTVALVDRNDFSFENNGERIHPDFAYITIHGTPGEDGKLQGYFDLIGIPYSTCSLLVAALTFNKFCLNQYLKGFGVRISDSVLVREHHERDGSAIAAQLGLPCFVKPCGGGSSFGVTRCTKAEDIEPALEKAFEEWPEALVEKAMTGMEVSNGVFRRADGSICVLPITEVVSHNAFFDFDAKYNGQVEEITPARLSESTTKRVQTLTSHIYDILGGDGIMRVDYFIDRNAEGADVVTLLEINATPGMTPTSFIPQQVAAAGMNMTEVLTEVIERKMV